MLPCSRARRTGAHPHGRRDGWRRCVGHGADIRKAVVGCHGHWGREAGAGQAEGIEACVCSLGSTACSSMPHACKREATASLLIASRCQGPHSLQQAHQVSQQAIARYASALNVRRFSRAVSGLPCHHTALLASLLCSHVSCSVASAPVDAHADSAVAGSAHLAAVGRPCLLEALRWETRGRLTPQSLSPPAQVTPCHAKFAPRRCKQS